MSYPSNYKYTKDHEWILVEGNTAQVGITKFAVEQLGDIVHVEMPKVGKKYKAGATFGTVESTKTVSDLLMPISCTVLEVNTEVAKAPETLAEDPHGKCWLIKIQIDGESEELINAAAYEAYIATAGH